MQETVTPKHQKDALAVFEQMGGYHPNEPHKNEDGGLNLGRRGLILRRQDPCSAVFCDLDLAWDLLDCNAWRLCPDTRSWGTTRPFTSPGNAITSHS